MKERKNSARRAKQKTKKQRRVVSIGDDTTLPYNY